MSTAILYLDRDKKEFHRVANWVALRVGATPRPVRNGHDLVAAAERYDDRSVKRIILLGHGSPTWFLRPGKAGMHRWIDEPPEVVSTCRFADAWEPKMRPNFTVALAACSCSRSPKWYLKRFMPAFLGAWGVGAYSDGGELSLAQQLADCFYSYDLNPAVRGHTVKGHCTDCPCVREHSGWSKTGIALINRFRADPSKPPTRAERRQWVRAFKGPLAREWICGINDHYVMTRLG